MTTIHWQHQNVTANEYGEVGGTSPYDPGWGEVLQFGGWANPNPGGFDDDEPEYNDGKMLLPLAGTWPSLNGSGDFVQGGLRFIATPGATVRVHSWSITSS